MNIKRATVVIDSQLSTLNLKNNKLSKQPEQEQNHRYGDHMEGYQLREGKGRMRKKVQGVRSINGRYIIDGGVSRIV